jgi:AcrR family transcriptional regulator
MTGATARRERGRREMRSAILEVAGGIVDAGGMDALTIRAVAQAIGYSPGALYEYFDSKEAILATLYFDGADGLGVHCDRAVTSVPADAGSIAAIVALGHAYRAYALAHPDLYRLVFGGLKALPKQRPEDCADEPSGGLDTLIGVLQRGMASGELASDIPPEAIAISTWSAVHGFVSLELTGHLTGGDAPGVPAATPEAGQEQRDRLFEAHMRMTMLGLASDAHRAHLASVRDGTS